MMFSCRLAGRSVSAMPVDVGWRRRREEREKRAGQVRKAPSPGSEASEGTASHPFDLDVVQLLLPLHDVLHAVHPDVDVAHQHGLAHVLNQAAQRQVEHLEQLLDGPDVLLVIQH